MGASPPLLPIQPLLAMVLLVLSVGGTDALSWSGPSGTEPWLNKSLEARERLRGVTIDAIGLCWGGWAPCWPDLDVSQRYLARCVLGSFTRI